jgi:hypothetical protein
MKGFLFMKKPETSLGRVPIPKEAPWKTLVLNEQSCQGL